MSSKAFTIRGLVLSAGAAPTCWFAYLSQLDMPEDEGGNRYRAGGGGPGKVS
jgi:hypothetical protein